MNPRDDLYQGILLAHGSSPKNRRRLPQPSASGEAANPLCGDRLDVDLRIADERIEEASFEGYLCIVSQASASLMTEALRGRPTADARSLHERFTAMMRTGEASKDLGELEALRAVRGYRVRLRCALLPWEALQSALAGAGR